MKTCRRCLASYPPSGFHKNRGNKDGLSNLCKSCQSEVNKAYHHKHREHLLLRMREWHARNRDRVLAYNKERSKRIKTEVMSHYGGRCRCCGEHRLPFLTIDHVHNDGASHRRQLHAKSRGRGAGEGFYKWLIRHGFPEGFQVLCFNCNCGKWVNGGACPHQVPPT